MNASITLTGADERTDLDRLVDLEAEIGLLYTDTPEGRNRYPSRDWIAFAVARLPMAAVHICGRAARAQLAKGLLGDIVGPASRIQVNGLITAHEVEELCARYPHQDIITQFTPGSADMLQARAQNHSVLVDASGGRGILPDLWIRPATDKSVGFAGGLGADNLEEQLERLIRVTPAGPRWWVDMEGRLRENDWFCVKKARRCVEIFQRFYQARCSAASINRFTPRP